MKSCSNVKLRVWLCFDNGEFFVRLQMSKSFCEDIGELKLVAGNEVEDSKSGEDCMADVLEAALNVAGRLGGLVGVSLGDRTRAISENRKRKGALGIAKGKLHEHFRHMSTGHDCYTLSVTFCFAGRLCDGLRDK